MDRRWTREPWDPACLRPCGLRPSTGGRWADTQLPPRGPLSARPPTWDEPKAGDPHRSVKIPRGLGAWCMTETPRFWKGGRQEVTAGQPQLPLPAGRAWAAPELQGAARNVIQELPGSGKILVFWELKILCGSPCLPVPEPRSCRLTAHPGETSSLCAPRPQPCWLWAQKHPSSVLMPAGLPQAVSPAASNRSPSQVPSLALVPTPAPHPSPCTPHQQGLRNRKPQPLPQGERLSAVAGLPAHQAAQSSVGPGPFQGLLAAA